MKRKIIAAVSALCMAGAAFAPVNTVTPRTAALSRSIRTAE